MDPAKIKSFIEKFSKGNYSEEEHQEFIEWLKKAPISEVEAIAERYDLIGEHSTLSKNDHSNLVGRIEAALDQWDLGRQAKGKVVSIYWIKRIAVAASIIFTVGLGSYFLFFNNKKSTAIAQFKNDVDPGKFKAKLKLADGKEIILDSAINGELTKQGGTVVVNKD